MMTERISLDELYTGLSNLVGMEKARSLVDDAIRAEGVELKRMYTSDELMSISRRLRRLEGAIPMVVSAICSRLILRH